MNIILKTILYKSLKVFLQIKMKILSELSHFKIIHKIFVITKNRYFAKLPPYKNHKITWKDWNLS